MTSKLHQAKVAMLNLKCDTEELYEHGLIFSKNKNTNQD